MYSCLIASTLLRVRRAGGLLSETWGSNPLATRWEGMVVIVLSLISILFCVFMKETTMQERNRADQLIVKCHWKGGRKRGV